MVKARSRSPRYRETNVCKFQETEGGIVDIATGSTLNFDALSVSVSQEKWVEKAATIFRKYRVLILEDLFSTKITDMLLKTLQDVHANWSATGDPYRYGNRMSGRYEMMDAYDCWHLTHLPGYLEALEEFARKGGLDFLQALGGCTFVGGHAHLCLAGTANVQPLHSDFTYPKGKVSPLRDDPEHVAFMDLLFTLHPLTNDNAPLRLIPGQPTAEKTYLQFLPTGEGFPPPSLEQEPDLWSRAKIYPLPAGCGVLRDLRIWHGGTPNTSTEDRYTAVLRFYSDHAAGLWKDDAYEIPSVDKEDIQEKLSVDTQRIVAEHIIRSDSDPRPKLLPFEGWQSHKNNWYNWTRDDDDGKPAWGKRSSKWGEACWN